MTSLVRLCTLGKKYIFLYLFIWKKCFVFFLVVKTDEVISHMAGRKRARSSDTDVSSSFTFRLLSRTNTIQGKTDAGVCLCM